MSASRPFGNDNLVTLLYAIGEEWRQKKEKKRKPTSLLSCRIPSACSTSPLLSDYIRNYLSNNWLFDNIQLYLAALNYLVLDYIGSSELYG